jgi:hypothetical protein
MGWFFSLRRVVPPSPPDSAIAHTKALYQQVVDLAAECNFPNSTTFRDDTLSRLTTFVVTHHKPAPHPALFQAFLRCIHTVYEQEHLHAPPPLPPDKLLPGIEGARLRDLLRASLKKYSDPAAAHKAVDDAVLSSFYFFTEYLPEFLKSSDLESFSSTLESELQVRLIEVAPQPGRLVQAFIHAFTSSELDKAGIFVSLAEQFYKNCNNASGYPYPSRARAEPSQIVQPVNSELPASELAEAYLAGTPFLDLARTIAPLDIPAEQRFSHHWIIAPPGHGKTQTLQYFIARDLERVARCEASVIVIDSQGDLINNILGLSAFAEDGELAGKLVLIDPEDVNYPVALNLFDVGLNRIDTYSDVDREALLNATFELYDYILTALLGAEMTSRQATLFRFTLQLILQIPEATIHTLRELMEPRGLEPYRQYLSQLDPTARQFFETRFDTKQFDQTKEQVAARLYAILTNRTLSRMFSSTRSKLDLFTEMNSSKVILINCSKRLLQETGTEIFGRFFLALIAMAAAERATLPEARRLPCFAYVDECQDYIRADEKITIILEQARKQKVGVILAHQLLSQISPRVLDSLYGATAIKFAAAVSDANAHALARNMRTTPQFIEEQPQGSFAGYMRPLTPRAVSIRIPPYVMEKLPRMSEHEQDRLRDHMRATYAEPHSTLHQVTQPSPMEEAPPPAQTAQRLSPPGSALGNAVPKAQPFRNKNGDDLASEEY